MLKLRRSGSKAFKPEIVRLTALSECIQPGAVPLNSNMNDFTPTKNLDGLTRRGVKAQ
jgi:hypothetical protein